MNHRLLVLAAVLTWAAPQLAWAEPCTHGDFQAARVLASRPNPFGVAAGDLNGDGHADAVSVSLTDAVVTVALGNGDTTFQAGVDYAVGIDNPDTVVLRDLNEDDKPDIVVSSSAFGSSAVLSIRSVTTRIRARRISATRASAPFRRSRPSSPAPSPTA